MISTGDHVRNFAKRISEFNNSKFAVVTASGTNALTISLRAIGVEPGDEVIVPTYVCDSVLHSVKTLGARAVLADTNEMGLITVDSVKRLLRRSTKAIIAAHVFGNLADIESLKALGILVIEDACQAFGSTYPGRPGIRVGTLGDVGIFSFHPTKPITSGGGGAVITESPLLYKKILENLSVDSFPRMSDLQATLGLSQISRFPEFDERRRNLYSQYKKRASELNLKINLNIDLDSPFRFTLKTTGQFEVLQQNFLDHGIHVRRGVDSLLHRIEGLSDYNHINATELYNSNLSVPFHPSLTDEEVRKVLESLELAQ